MGTAVVVAIGGSSKYVHARTSAGLSSGKLTCSVTPQGLCDASPSLDGRSLIVAAPEAAKAGFGSIEMTWTPADGSPALDAVVPVAVVAPSDSELDWTVT